MVAHKENGGLSDARNAGLALCCGGHVIFVDSDDVIHRSYIESLYNALRVNVEPMFQYVNIFHLWKVRFSFWRRNVIAQRHEKRMEMTLSSVVFVFVKTLN